MELDCQLINHPQKRGVLSILLDEECVANVHTSIVGKRFKLPEDLTSKNALITWLEAQIASNARRYALWRLSKGPMSVNKLRQTLQEKCVPDDVCEEVIAHFLRLGFLDDAAYAEQLSRSKKRSLHGKQAVKWACLKQSIDPELAVEAYTASTTADDERKAILAFASKRRNRPQTPQERQKLIAALMRRGFTYSTIKDALESHESESSSHEPDE